ncbi:ABC transporter ATP-binding protein [Bradyrhizobium cytisi]|uniref:ABC transporter ATP-binding protein n=1 Tax=Bradyrhizobium cytisi TaxID=515489 RepID=A0A5S4WWA5_9BRAD|nr:ABC transporter ATP-binding protein [Bradyrhizobium cytisi]TYL85848.1 ABC transporter ATP-binding protein [Bradyrhizobium cytisi]
MIGQTILEANAVTLRYDGDQGNVLDPFDFALKPGETIGILGPSGVGKSSLLRVLAGLQQPSSGAVHIRGQALWGPHPRVSIAFQDPSLLPWLTLERNVAFGLDFKHQPQLSRAERARRVDEAIAEVGLSSARNQFPDQLSGGMAQRAALARCLAREPDILLLDEPFGALDEVTRSQMQRLLLKIVSDLGTAVVLITHDIDEALLVSDRIVLLGGSPARQIGEWTVDLAKPRDDDVSELGRLRVDIVSALRRASPAHHKDEAHAV